MRPLTKRCRILPAGGLGVSPSYKYLPRLGDIGGLLRVFQQFPSVFIRRSFTRHSEARSVKAISELVDD